jgi:hypothetical protein
VITFALPEQPELNGTPYVRVASDRELTRSEDFTSDVSEPVAPERALAAGVLRQAASDLRRFRKAQGAVGRELYLDARSWFIANDTEWPYSFTNVCRLLGLSPEGVRDEVFADARSGWISHSGRVALATATQLVGSFSTLFSSRRSHALAVRHS